MMNSDNTLRQRAPNKAVVADQFADKIICATRSLEFSHRQSTGLS